MTESIERRRAKVLILRGNPMQTRMTTSAVAAFTFLPLKKCFSLLAGVVFFTLPTICCADDLNAEAPIFAAIQLLIELTMLVAGIVVIVTVFKVLKHIGKDRIAPLVALAASLGLLYGIYYHHNFDSISYSKTSLKEARSRSIVDLTLPTGYQGFLFLVNDYRLGQKPPLSPDEREVNARTYEERYVKLRKKAYLITVPEPGIAYIRFPSDLSLNFEVIAHTSQGLLVPVMISAVNPGSWYSLYVGSPQDYDHDPNRWHEDNVLKEKLSHIDGNSEYPFDTQ